ncbi:MAG: AEC family transporter, partial [Cyanobacteria bacterium P01_D01_bin.73]
ARDKRRVESGRSHSLMESIGAGLANPTFVGAIAGIILQKSQWPELVDQGLQGFAWTVVAAAIMLIGMRLSHWRPRRSLAKVWPSLLIKQGIMPLALGIGLRLGGITSPLLLTLVLQAAMPPAFATIVLSEAYDLDRELAVTAIAVGIVSVLALLPVWLWAFS